MKKISDAKGSNHLASYSRNLLAGSDEKGVVNAGQGKGETSDGDSYITLGKQHNAWNTWDEEE